MTDFSEQVYIEEGQPPLDDVLFYDGLPSSDFAQASPPASQEHIDSFPIDSCTTQIETDQNARASHDGIPYSYILQSVGSDLHTYPVPYLAHSPVQTHQTDSNQGEEGTLKPVSCQPMRVNPASPAMMTEFFHMMSHPENVHAYMHFLQTQHEQQPQTQAIPASPRARSNSQPTSSSLPTAFPSRTSTTEAAFDTQSRERKLARYRTKRARRLTTSQPNSNDASASTVPATTAANFDTEHFMPAPKIPKTLAHGTCHLTPKLVSATFRFASRLPSRPPLKLAVQTLALYKRRSRNDTAPIAFVFGSI